MILQKVLLKPFPPVWIIYETLVNHSFVNSFHILIVWYDEKSSTIATGVLGRQFSAIFWLSFSRRVNKVVACFHWFRTEKEVSIRISGWVFREIGKIKKKLWFRKKKTRPRPNYQKNPNPKTEFNFDFLVFHRNILIIKTYMYIILLKNYHSTLPKKVRNTTKMYNI